jgi:hypothetical protein
MNPRCSRGPPQGGRKCGRVGLARHLAASSAKPARSPVRGRASSVKRFLGPGCHSPRVAVSVCIPSNARSSEPMHGRARTESVMRRCRRDRHRSNESPSVSAAAVPARDLSGGDIAPPIRDVLRDQKNARVVFSEVIEVFVQAAIELRNEEQGVTIEVLSSGDERACRSDQLQLWGQTSRVGRFQALSKRLIFTVRRGSLVKWGSWSRTKGSRLSSSQRSCRPCVYVRNHGGSTSSLRWRLNCSTVPKWRSHSEHPVCTILCSLLIKVDRLCH